MTFFETPGEKFSINAFQVLQVVDDSNLRMRHMPGKAAVAEGLEICKKF